MVSIAVSGKYDSFFRKGASADPSLHSCSIANRTVLSFTGEPISDKGILISYMFPEILELSGVVYLLTDQTAADVKFTQPVPLPFCIILVIPSSQNSYNLSSDCGAVPPFFKGSNTISM